MSPSPPEDLPSKRADRPRGAPFGAVVGLFIASGAAALVDQFCFSKYLSYVVGSTAYAVSAVLAAFMTGMALGALLGGRFAERIRRPLLTYGVLEIGVALLVLVVPAAFAVLTPLYVSLLRDTGSSVLLAGGVRWLCAVAVVILPTTAMGATLPLLSRLVETDGVADARIRRRRLGTLYAANTLGGALGALGGAYYVVPALGLSSALYVAALVSAIVGVVSVVLGRAKTPLVSTGAEAAPAELAGAPRRLEKAELSVLTGLALFSGWVVFACEIVFTHLLSLTIGNSAFAFGLILAIFLVCLFAGASLAPLAASRLGAGALPVALGAAAVALMATQPAWDELPSFFQGMGGRVTTFAEREIVRGLAAFSVLVVPTTLMGLTFPLVLLRVAESDRVASLVGRLTSINTIGAVFGSIATGYFVLPWLGSQGTMSAIAGTFAAGAAATVIVSRDKGRLAKVGLGLAGATAIAILVTPKWDLARLTSGTNVYFENYNPPEEILSIAEDVHGGVTTVTRKDDVTTLWTNGKFQGNDGPEVSAQRYFAHYPSLFVHRFDRALVIGLGTGTTTGTMAAYPWKHIDVVEISPSIVDAARRYFSGVNRGALDDERVTLTLADGRNFLLLSEERYDLIGMELTSIWFAGASSLYSREFYQLVRSRLREDGIFQQWVQLHHLYPRDFATLVATLRAEFAHVALFYGGGQGILVSSNAPLAASRARLDELTKDAELGALLGRDPLALLGDILLTGPGVDAFLAQAARDAGLPVESLLSTDDNLYLEYATPRGNVLPWGFREELISKIAAHRSVDHIDALMAP